MMYEYERWLIIYTKNIFILISTKKLSNRKKCDLNFNHSMEIQIFLFCFLFRRISEFAYFFLQFCICEFIRVNYFMHNDTEYNFMWFMSLSVRNSSNEWVGKLFSKFCDGICMDVFILIDDKLKLVSLSIRWIFWTSEILNRLFK